MADEMVELSEAGYSYGQIAKMLGCTRNAVAGRIHRVRHPYVRKGRQPFRDETFVRNAVAVSEAMGLSKAARSLGIDITQLCKWRQRIRAMDAA